MVNNEVFSALRTGKIHPRNRYLVKLTIPSCKAHPRVRFCSRSRLINKGTRELLLPGTLS